MAAIEKLRLYLETTVFNYYFDEDREGHRDVVELFEAIGAGEYEGYTSNYVVNELMAAQEPKRGAMLSLIERYRITRLEITPKAVRLAELYIAAGAVPASHFYDSAHIAAANVYELRYIVSYNFKHINRAKTRRLTADVNSGEGYGNAIICTAEEVLSDE